LSVPQRSHRKQGSSLVETCIVIALLCLILFGLFQVSYVVSSRNIISYSAMVAARAAAVGLDEEMVQTVLHYTTIPTAGPMVHPDQKAFRRSRPDGETVGEQWDNALAGDEEVRSEIGAYEAAMVEEFHRRDYPLAVLNYANWSPEGEVRIVSDFDESDYDEEILEVTVSQKLPLTYPFARVFFWHLPLVEVARGNRSEEYPGKQIDFTGIMENHARFYLKDVH
jgi:hypothetical protein